MTPSSEAREGIIEDDNVKVRSLSPWWAEWRGWKGRKKHLEGVSTEEDDKLEVELPSPTLRKRVSPSMGQRKEKRRVRCTRARKSTRAVRWHGRIEHVSCAAQWLAR